MSRLSAVALGVMLGWADMDAGEEGGNNSGPFVEKLLRNVDPPIHTAAAWCAAAVQGAWDIGARALGVPNPLDSVRREAYVDDYFARFEGYRVEKDEVEPGCLVLFEFNNAGRWNHIGIVASLSVDSRTFTTVEGNTSDESQRDGDSVAIKSRGFDEGYPIIFLDPSMQGVS